VSKNAGKASTKQTARIVWEFPGDVPTCDFFVERPLDDLEDLQEAVESFVFWLEKDCFLMWEAVISQEQNIPLSREQKKSLRNLLNFSDDEEEYKDKAILYIDEMPRPSEPWHVILNKIAPHLWINPFRTSDCHFETQCEGWSQIMAALQEHGQGLVLPPNAGSAMEVVPAELRHSLWLQSCFNVLDGMGQNDDDTTLDDPEECERIEWFIDGLRECRESVGYLGLTLNSLLDRIILPAKERPVFLKLMQQNLGIDSCDQPIAEHL